MTESVNRATVLAMLLFSRLGMDNINHPQPPTGALRMRFKTFGGLLPHVDIQMNKCRFSVIGYQLRK